MSISKISNSFSFSNKSQNKLRNFKGTENSEEKEFAAPEVSEEDLHYLASIGPDRKYMSSFKKAGVVMLSLPFVDSFVSGMLKEGNLSVKLAKSSRTMGLWGGVFAAGLIASGIKRVVNKKSQTLDSLDKKHSTMGFGIDMAAVYATFIGILASGRAINRFVVKKFPKLIQKSEEHVSKPIRNFLNDSLINKKIIMPLDKYMQKKMYHSYMAKIAGVLLVPAIAISAFVRLNKEAKVHNEQVENNFSYLKNLFETAIK